MNMKAGKGRSRTPILTGTDQCAIPMPSSSTDTTLSGPEGADDHLSIEMDHVA
jgi:hypothetical protein